MTIGDVVPEQEILFFGHALADVPGCQIGIGLENAAPASRHREILDDDAHRDAGVAAAAGRAIDDMMAAAHSALCQAPEILLHPGTRTSREDLPLDRESCGESVGRSWWLWVEPVPS